MVPTLSILVITHNQCGLIKRCLDSVLSQKLSVPFEIIVSDDRSSDGTDAFVEDLRNRVSGTVKNLVAFDYIRCNSDECHPANTSERCGWNKLNAYLHAGGKYFVNVDADDYLRSDDIYQLQVDALEAHPECSMCMQRSLFVNEGDPLENGRALPVNTVLEEGLVIPAEKFIIEDLRGVNPTYMIRRRPDDDMKALYGKWFDDTVITYHHLQYGPVVFVDRADYVWVQHQSSISHTMSRDDDTILYGLLPLFHAWILPSFAKLFLQSGIPVINHALKVAPEYPSLSDQYRNYFAQFKGFIYRYYLSSRHGLLTKGRFWVSRILLHLGIRFKFKSNFYLDLVSRSLI